jgi:putative membrane protein
MFHDWSWGLWLIMPFTMVVFWALVIWAVVALIQPSDRGSASGAPGPERILAERFARGEIDAGEYERRLSTLRNRTAA